jgi:hypothetical protein
VWELGAEDEALAWAFAQREALLIPLGWEMAVQDTVGAHLHNLDDARKAGDVNLVLKLHTP